MRADFVLFISVLFFSCIKEAKLDYREPEPDLVVEGLLLTDSTPCKVTLSYSGLFNKNGAQLQNFIDDAEVYLKDVDANDSVQLVNQQNGTYAATDGFVATAGKAYALNIHLSNGERYASIPERIIPVSKDLQ